MEDLHTTHTVILSASIYTSQLTCIHSRHVQETLISVLNVWANVHYAITEDIWLAAGLIRCHLLREEESYLHKVNTKLSLLA